jgi:hypothetical protein
MSYLHAWFIVLSAALSAGSGFATSWALCLMFIGLD